MKSIPRMTSRERMRAVLRGQIPDRVPFHPCIFFDFASVAMKGRFEDWILNPFSGCERMLAAALRFKTDMVRFMMTPGDEWSRTKEVKEENGQLFQYDRQSGRTEGVFDTSGGGTLNLFEPPAPVLTIRDAESIPVLPATAYALGGYLRGIPEAIRLAHDQGLFVCGFCTGQTINFMADKMNDTAAALLTFYDNPDLARMLIRKASDISIEKGKAWIAAGADMIYIGDSNASASVISPALYREFCAPAYRRVATALQQEGAFVYKHCCGSYNALLDDLPATGVDAMDGIDPTREMTVAHTKAVIGQKMVLMGGVSCLTLLNGTPQQNYDEAVRCIEEGKPEGRYVLGSACAVPRNSPPENIDALHAALEDRGWYP